MAEILGAIGTCMTLATTLIDTTLRVKELCESYQSAQANLTLIRTRVSTLSVALSQIEEWTHTAPATQSNEEVKTALKEVLESITTVLGGIMESLRAVQEAWKPGLRYLWDEGKLAGFGRDLSEQTGDLHFLFSAVNWTQSQKTRNAFSTQSTETFGESINGCVRRAATIASGYANSRRDIISEIGVGADKENGEGQPKAMTPPTTPPPKQPSPTDENLTGSSATLVNPGLAIDAPRRSSVLLSAVKLDSVEGLRNLLAQGVKVDEQVEGQSILSQCVQHSSVNAATFLVESGAKIRSQDLITATTTGSFRIVRRLLLNGAPVDAIGYTSDSPLEKWSALHVAAHSGDRDIVKLLLDNNANINLKSDSGVTPLHVSADETICMLLDHGASVFAKDNRGRIPLHIKARQGRLFAVQTLIEHGSPINLRDYQGVTPIISAVLYGNNALVTELVRAGANVHARVSAEALCNRMDKEHWKAQLQDLSLLHFAVSTPHCSIDVIKTLIGAGVPIDIRSADGSTPLQWSCLPSNLFRLAEIGTDADITPNASSSNTSCKEASEAARYLIRRGANVNAVNKRKWTPLHTAALNDTHAIAKLLLEYGASTSAKEDWGRTPLRVAIIHNSDRVIKLLLSNRSRRSIEFESLHAAAHYNSDKAAKSLLQHGISINQPNADGKTALHVACERNSTKAAEVLLEYGADIEALDAEGCTPLLTASEQHALPAARLLLEHGARIQHTDRDGLAPLHHAARNNSVQMASLLLRYGANVNQRGGELGVRPLHAAAWRDAVAVAQVLIANGADVNACDGNGWTALHDAASKNAVGIAALLIECSGDVNARTRRTRSSVLDIAMDYKAGRELVDCVVASGGQSLKRERKGSDYV